jgi:hypothetical protein
MTIRFKQKQKAQLICKYVQEMFGLVSEKYLFLLFPFMICLEALEVLSCPNFRAADRY